MTNACGIEAAWVHAVSSVPEDGLEQNRTPTAAELEALASYLAIPAVERLRVRYRIDPLPRGRFHLTGEIDAKVVQACIVSLDPVVSDLREAMNVEFWPASALPVAVETGAEQTILDAAEHEPIEDSRLAIGRVVVETLAAAMPAFPRAPGAELEQTEAAPEGGGTANPFAALADWKPKPK